MHLTTAVADPGFPVGGGMDLVWGAVDPRGSYILKILHVKMKESGPVGGARAGRAPLDPPMIIFTNFNKNTFIVTRRNTYKPITQLLFFLLVSFLQLI